MLPFGKTISAQEGDSFILQPVLRKGNVSWVSLANPTSATISDIPQTLQMLFKSSHHYFSFSSNDIEITCVFFSYSDDYNCYR